MSKLTTIKSQKVHIELKGHNRCLEYKEGFEYGNGVSICKTDKCNYRHTLYIEPTEGGPEDWIEGFIAELKELQSAIIESRT